MMMNNDPEHITKTAPEFMKAKKWNILYWPNQSPDLKSSFSVTEDKTEGRKTHKQAATEGGCSDGLAKHRQHPNIKIYRFIHGYVSLSTYF